MSELRVAPEGAHPLPDGGWVVFRDVATIRQRDRKALVARMDTARKGGAGDISTAMSAGDAIIALAVLDWSYDLPVPAMSIDSLDELEIPHYDALAALVEPFKDALFPNPTAEPSGDDTERTSPTGPSAA